MEIVYRKLKPDEAELYRALRLEALLTAPQSFGKTFEEESAIEQLLFEKYITEQYNDRFVFGVFSDKELLGMCCFSKEQGIKRKHVGMLTQMFVKPNQQSKNIGKELFRKIIEVAFQINGLEQITLGVVGTNDKAYKIYLKAGFEECGYHKKYFKTMDSYLDERFMVLYKASWNKDVI